MFRRNVGHNGWGGPEGRVVYRELGFNRMFVTLYVASFFVPIYVCNLQQISLLLVYMGEEVVECIIFPALGRSHVFRTAIMSWTMRVIHVLIILRMLE